MQAIDPGTGDRALVDRELLAKGDVLRRELRAVLQGELKHLELDGESGIAGSCRGRRWLRKLGGVTVLESPQKRALEGDAGFSVPTGTWVVRLGAKANGLSNSRNVGREAAVL